MTQFRNRWFICMKCFKCAIFLKTMSLIVLFCPNLYFSQMNFLVYGNIYRGIKKCKRVNVLLYCKNIYFEAFCCVTSSSINLLFLKHIQKYLNIIFQERTWKLPNRISIPFDNIIPFVSGIWTYIGKKKKNLKFFT